MDIQLTSPGREQSRARYPDSSGYIKRDGVRLYYEVYGSGGPTVFLLPTWSIIHSRHWKMQIPYLARHCRVLTFDGRGNGRSDRPPAGYGEDQFAADANFKVVAQNEVPKGWRILDIGPKAVEAFQKALSNAQTIVWNGTLGVAEMPAFAKGTDAIIEILASRTRAGAITIIGGGDSAAAVEEARAAEKMTHVSTGGGASLEFLEGRVLPGVAALQDK